MNKSVFFSYLKNNKTSFLMLIIIFGIGITAGIAFINYANEVQIEEIGSYVNSLKENIKNSDDINKTLILTQSIKQNVGFVIMIWFLGCTILGSFLIYLVIIGKGFSIGYTISAMVATLGVKSRNYFCSTIIIIAKSCFSSNDFYII